MSYVESISWLDLLLMLAVGQNANSPCKYLCLLLGGLQIDIRRLHCSKLIVGKASTLLCMSLEVLVVHWLFL